jgi:hypothetical protein
MKGKQSGIHTGSGVKTPKLKTKQSKATPRSQGYDGSTKGKRK